MALASINNVTLHRYHAFLCMLTSFYSYQHGLIRNVFKCLSCQSETVILLFLGVLGCVVLVSGNVIHEGTLYC